MVIMMADSRERMELSQLYGTQYVMERSVFYLEVVGFQLLHLTKFQDYCTTK